MTAQPQNDYIGVSSRTQTEVKDWLEDLRDFQTERPGGEAETELTIATGSVTPTRAVHSVDTESDDAADDLANIATTNLIDGSVLFLRQEVNARVVTVKHEAGGAGQIHTIDGNDIDLSKVTQDGTGYLMLVRVGADWYEVTRSTTSAQRDVGGILHESKFALLQYEVSSGTNGGSTTASTWVTRPLNTEKFNPGGIVTSLASNQFQLKAGTYLIEAWGQVVRGERVQMRLRDASAGTTKVVGVSHHEQLGAANRGAGHCYLCGVFDAIAGNNYELQQIVGSALATEGLGSACSFGDVEVFTSIELMQLG